MKPLEMDYLVKIVEMMRHSGNLISTTNGCFDVLHVGHLRYLQEIRKRSPGLVVCLINSDVSVRFLKGDDRPVNCQDDRAEALVLTKYVDYVSIMTGNDPCEDLKRIRPDIHFKGRDWENKECPERRIIVDGGGEMRFLDYHCGYSTTEIINKIRK